MRLRMAVALGVLSAGAVLVGCSAPATVASSEPQAASPSPAPAQKKYPLRITLLVHPLPGAADATRCVVSTIPPYADFWTTLHSEVEWRIVNNACPGLKVRVTAVDTNQIKLLESGEGAKARIVGALNEDVIRRGVTTATPYPDAGGQPTVKYNVHLDGSRPAFTEDPVIVIWP